MLVILPVESGVFERCAEIVRQIGIEIGVLGAALEDAALDGQNDQHEEAQP